MADAWVTLERFVDPVAAQVARSVLEAEGVPCFLADEGMGGLFSYSLVKGVRLQVRPEDRERAAEILAAPPSPEDWPADDGEGPGEP